MCTAYVIYSHFWNIFNIILVVFDKFLLSNVLTDIFFILKMLTKYS